jgi:hypothetical protein
MSNEALAEFWRFTKAEIKVAVYRFFMPVRVVAQEMYRIVHESDAEQQNGSKGGWGSAGRNLQPRLRPGSSPGQAADERG